MALTHDQIDLLRNKLLEEQQKTRATLDSLTGSDPVNDPDRANDNADQGGDATETTEIDRHEVLERQTSFMLKLIEEALARIEDGTYGKTAEGKDIPFERLMVDPTATTLVTMNA